MEESCLCEVCEEPEVRASRRMAREHIISLYTICGGEQVLPGQCGPVNSPPPPAKRGLVNPPPPPVKRGPVSPPPPPAKRGPVNPPPPPATLQQPPPSSSHRGRRISLSTLLPSLLGGFLVLLAIAYGVYRLVQWAKLQGFLGGVAAADEEQQRQQMRDAAASAAEQRLQGGGAGRVAV
ncbi:hypothetical protein ACQJBY_014451 [Aegilops geniculata]